MTNKDLLLKKYQELDSFEKIELLRFDQAGSDEETPLHIASYGGDIEDLMIMLDMNVDVNVRGDIGNTPLHEATLKKHKKIISALLAAGADPMIKNDYDDTPLDIAERKGNKKIISLLTRKAQ